MELRQDAMTIEFNKILDDVLKQIPSPVNLKLPKLKKVGSKDDKPATIKLPKLKKVDSPKIKLPKLKKV